MLCATQLILLSEEKHNKFLQAILSKILYCSRIFPALKDTLFLAFQKRVSNSVPPIQIVKAFILVLCWEAALYKWLANCTYVTLWYENIHSRTLQGKSHLCIPFLGNARPQSRFPHSCVCERFIYSQDRSLQQNGRPILEMTEPGNTSISHRYISEKLGDRTL